ncbi:MAG: nuclear transport factor 2 family protein [Bacteroidetes bacterium]|nr:MAG: nuclear transport factor 2 family protein [Bacteroidota bacterium]
MKVLKLVLIAITAISFTNCSPEKQQQILSEADKEALVETLEKFNQAFRDGNTALLQSMITDNYIHTNGNSKSIGKDTWLNYLRKREKDIQTGNLEVLNYTMEDLEITYHNNVAIATGKILVSSKRQNEVVDNEYRITNIWVFESGLWKRAGFHDGKIK